VWNAQNQLMPNGDNLLGGVPNSLSSTTAAVIIPVPNSSTNYYLVTVDEQNSNSGINYSIVDMRLDNGKGDIVSGKKNLPLQSDAAEKAAVAVNATKDGFWLVAHSKNGDTFSAYSVTAQGISTTPVNTNIGANLANASGYMKFNATGTKLANTNPFGSVDLLDFNPATGVFSNAIKLTLPAFSVYGLEFSPDGSKLYVSSIFDGIFQFDISSNNEQQIQSTRSFIPGSNQAVGLQIGPDCRIYVSGGGLGVIKKPDLAGSACDFNVSALPPTAGVGSSYGLPMKVLVFPDSGTTPSIIASDSCFNATTALSIKNTIAYSSIEWDFDDPSSSSNSDTGLITSHVFSKPGLFKVKAKVYFGCDVTIVEKDVTIVDCNVKVICDPSLAILDTCLENPVLFSISPADSVISAQWNFGDPRSGASNRASGNPVSHLFSDSGNYRIKVFLNLRCGSDTIDTLIRIGKCTIPEPCTTTISNVFTPNNDGLNDSFGLISPCVLTNYVLSIYNRWGQMVFRSDRKEDAWDGKINETLASEGVYVYTLEFVFPDGTKQRRNGCVQLLR
jgi:gliding motility-associated-like protein